MISTPDHLGIGIYTPAEAAFYARVSQRLITRWIFGDSSSKPVIERQLKNPSEKIFTFLDFVQALAIREVRSRFRLPLQLIREGVEAARERYGLDYPLARPHRIFLFSDQQRSGHGHIVIMLQGDEDGDEDKYVQLTGHNKGNYLLKPIVEMFLDKLTFDPETKLALQYRPMVDDDAAVLLDPHRRFGEPIIEPGGYTAGALWDATNAEGGLEAAAEAYGVSVKEVSLANKYYDLLLSPNPREL